jgi:hypothetical protein
MQRTVRMDHLRQVGTNHLPAPDDHGSVSLCATPRPLQHILSLFVILQPPTHFCGLPPLPHFVVLSLSYSPYPWSAYSLHFSWSCLCSLVVLPLRFPNPWSSFCPLLSVVLRLPFPIHDPPSVPSCLWSSPTLPSSKVLTLSILVCGPTSTLPRSTVLPLFLLSVVLPYPSLIHGPSSGHYCLWS